MAVCRLVLCLLLILCTIFATTSAFRPFISRAVRRMAAATPKAELPKDESGWRTILSPNQFAVLRQKATEPGGYSETTPGALEYDLKKSYGTKNPKEGVYNCVGCGTPLYKASTKFDSGCGWPAFFQGIEGAIKEVPDADGRRVEIVCSSCEGHLGHVFKNEGFANPTNERHCVNGICLRYDPAV